MQGWLKDEPGPSISILWLVLERGAVTQLRECPAKGLELCRTMFKCRTVICTCDEMPNYRGGVQVVMAKLQLWSLHSVVNGVGLAGTHLRLPGPSGEDVPADVSIGMIESYATLLSRLRRDVEVVAKPIDGRYGPRSPTVFAQAIQGGKSCLAVVVAPGSGVTAANHECRLLRGEGDAGDAHDWVIHGRGATWRRSMPWNGLAYRVVYADTEDKTVHVFDASGEKDVTNTSVWGGPFVGEYLGFAGGFLGGLRHLPAAGWKTRLHAAHEVLGNRQGLWVTAVLKMLMAYSKGGRGYDVALQHPQGSVEDVELELHTGMPKAGQLPPTLVPVPKLPIKLGDKPFLHSIPPPWLEVVTAFARKVFPGATVVSHVGRRSWTWPDNRSVLQICGGGTENGRRYLQIERPVPWPGTPYQVRGRRPQIQRGWAKGVWLRLPLAPGWRGPLRDFMDRAQSDEYASGNPAIAWLDGSQSEQTSIRKFIHRPVCIGTSWSPRRGVGTALLAQTLPGGLMAFMLAMNRMSSVHSAYREQALPTKIWLMIVCKWHDAVAHERSVVTREWVPSRVVFGLGSGRRNTLHELFGYTDALSGVLENNGAQGFTCTDQTFGPYRDISREPTAEGLWLSCAHGPHWHNRDLVGPDTDLEIAGRFVPNGFCWPPAPLLTDKAAEYVTMCREAALTACEGCDCTRTLPAAAVKPLAVLQRLGLAPLGNGMFGEINALVIKYTPDEALRSTPTGGAVLMYPLQQETGPPVDSAGTTVIRIGKHVACVGWEQNELHQYTGEGYALMIKHRCPTYPYNPTYRMRVRSMRLGDPYSDAGYKGLGVQPTTELSYTSVDAKRLADDDGQQPRRTLKLQEKLAAHADDLKVLDGKLARTLAAVGHGPPWRKAARADTGALDGRR